MSGCAPKAHRTAQGVNSWLGFSAMKRVGTRFFSLKVTMIRLMLLVYAMLAEM